MKGKSADTFAPLGPFLATADETRATRGVCTCGSRSTATMRQRSTTANMIFGVPALVSYVSQFMTLLPGDVISTGTPAGVALGMKPTPVYLKAGDVVALGIDGLGEARQRVVDCVMKRYVLTVNLRDDPDGDCRLPGTSPPRLAGGRREPAHRRRAAAWTFTCSAVAS